jgi:hypothetical protein
MHGGVAAFPGRGCIFTAELGDCAQRGFRALANASSKRVFAGPPITNYPQFGARFSQNVQIFAQSSVIAEFRRFFAQLFGLHRQTSFYGGARSNMCPAVTY